MNQITSQRVEIDEQIIQRNNITHRLIKMNLLKKITPQMNQITSQRVGIGQQIVQRKKITQCLLFVGV